MIRIATDPAKMTYQPEFMYVDMCGNLVRCWPRPRSPPFGLTRGEPLA